MDRIDEILRVLEKHDNVRAEVFECRPEIYGGLCIDIRSKEEVNAQRGEVGWIPKYQIIVTDEGEVLASSGVASDPEFRSDEVKDLIADLRNYTNIEEYLSML
jgi:zona occludens toxin (predicted ATPase)